MANRAELKEYYEDNGWKATISKFRIAPKDLSVLLGKSKAKKKAKAKAKAKPKAESKAEPKAEKKRGPGRPRKEVAAAPKKPRKTKIPNVTTAEPKKKGKGGRKANPQKLIDRTIENLEKLRGLVAAA